MPRLPALSGVTVAGEPPPFTRLSTPVYSLSTRSADGSRATMNLVTYATPIAIAPVRKYALGLYVGTLSHELLRSTGRGALQILRQRHAPLTQLLGRTSGRAVDKLAALGDAGFGVTTAFGLPVLADAFGVMELRVASEFLAAGDHEVVLCDVVGHVLDQEGGGPGEAAGGGDDDLGPLYTQYLRDNAWL